MQIHTYIYGYIHACIHTHTYTYIHRQQTTINGGKKASTCTISWTIFIRTIESARPKKKLQCRVFIHLHMYVSIHVIMTIESACN